APAGGRRAANRAGSRTVGVTLARAGSALRSRLLFSAGRARASDPEPVAGDERRRHAAGVVRPPRRTGLDGRRGVALRRRCAATATHRRARTRVRPLSDAAAAAARTAFVADGAESRKPRAESRKPKAESREPRAESRQPKAESRESLRDVPRPPHFGSVRRGVAAAVGRR